MTHSHTDDASDSDADATPDPPDVLRDHLYAVVEELLANDGLFLALDFDGTLAAIERRPDEATIPDPTREAVAALAAEPNVAVAVVSGRELADVRERVGLADETEENEERRVSYAGNHGLEIHAGDYEVHPTASDAEEDLAALSDLLTEQLAEIDGVIVEDKGVTATVHHRLVDEEAVPTVVETVESLVAIRDDVRLTTGKDVLELRPAVEWDKGEAVRDLYDRLVPDDEQWLPMYLGDDTTDEAAFAVLGERGLGVKVGADPDTGAPYRVADPEAVREILTWLGEYGVTFLETDPRDGSDEAA